MYNGQTGIIPVQINVLKHLMNKCSTICIYTFFPLNEVIHTFIYMETDMSSLNFHLFLHKEIFFKAV